VEKYCTARQTTDDNKVRRMRITGWIKETTDTHSAYVILIAFQQQKWLSERAWLLHFYGYYLPCWTVQISWHHFVTASLPVFIPYTIPLNVKILFYIRELEL